MTFVVPFDGSTLSEAALARAVEYGDALGQEVVAVSVVPERKRFAREKGWIGEGESFDVDAAVETLRERVADVAPDVAFEAERIREYPPPEELADRVEQLALAHDPTVLFVGSENVGRIVTPLASVGAQVSDDPTYDVYLVRSAEPRAIAGLDAAADDREDV